MANSNSRKHARKVTLDAAVNNAIEKAVDARKVAAFTVGAAGVLAGAAFAFGATPAMAAEAGTAAPTDAAQTPVAAVDKAGKKAASKNNEAKEAETQDDAKKNQTDEKDQTDANKEAGEQTAKKEDTTEEQNKQSVAKTEDKKSDEEEKKQDTTVVGQDCDGSTTPESKPQSNSTIELSQDKKDTLPNMYAWGKSDNVYVESGQNTSVTFKFAKPTDGSTITKVAIFPSDTNGVDNPKSRGFLEYYSDDANAHQSYSGTYDFKVNNDGTATLTMSKLYRDGGLKNGESYSANRCIYLYGTDKDGKTVVLYKTNIARAATLIPPKNAGSIVLQYDEELNEDQIRAKLKQALDAPTAAKDSKSVREQIKTASTSKGVGGRTGANGAFVQTPDNPDEKVVITDNKAYDANQVKTINTVTSKQGDKVTTYKTGAQKLDTYLISDLGYKSEVLPLTVARYDTRIDKPIVEDTDPSKVSDEVKTEIKKKLARLNNVSLDQVTINDQGEFTINFAGVDAKDAPKIPLRDLVLKKLEEKDVTVPANDKAVFVANPLGYSNAELERIKQSILDANKDNKDLGLTSTDQITLSYVMGDLVNAGDANKGRSNGLQENNISVTIKTDKAVAEFTSDITKDKLTRLPDIRTDYNVELLKNKLDGRDSDEGFSWSDDKHTTLIYRYDPTKAKEFTAPEIVKLIKATPKEKDSGLRPLTGGEALDHEGTGGKARRSHMNYAIDGNGEPTTELTLGMMNGPYWIGNPQVANSDVNMGDEESKVGQYTWDKEAGPVTVASKQNKVFKTRLFVAPYALTYYRGVYTNPYQRDPNNTPKAINVIFVPQTNHKTKDLNESIGEHKTVAVEGKDVPTQSAYYNASDKVKKDYEDALKVAKQTLEKVGTTPDDQLSEQLKAEVDNATIKLNKARAALDGADTKKEDLQKSIDENGKAAEGANPASGTQATDRYKNVTEPDFKTPDGKADEARNNAAKEAKKAYDKALEDAKALKDDKNATQKAVDEAKAKLDAARAKLNDFTTNKDELNNAIAQHGHVNTGRDAQGTQDVTKADPTYQNSSNQEQKAYDKAVAEAQKVVADPNASQKEVNEAIKKLKEAKAALDKNATDKSPLDAAVQKSFDNPNPKDASKQSVFYQNAAAKKDTDPAAKKAVEDYDKALKKAKDVLADKNATKKDVEDAKKALEDAEAALHADKYQTKKTDLAQALADNFSGYLMPAYFNAFDKAQADGKDSQAAKDFKAYNDAYQAAKDLMTELNKPNITITQDKVDAVKNQLLAARKIIDKYATNTSRLSAAVLNDIAIQKSPAYKNVSAADASEEAKEAKKKYDAAVKKLHDALANKLPKDQANGQDIPDSNIPKKDGDLNNKDYLKDIQAHKNGEPLNRDVDEIIKEMNAAAAELNKFATKTDALLKSVNEDAATHQNPAFKNASHPDYKNESGQDDTDKNGKASKAVDDYGKALNEAKELLKNPAATQKEVNDALKKLDDARKALDAYNTDTTKLEKSVEKHGSTEGAAPTEGTQTSDAYRNASDPHFMKKDGDKLVPDDDKNKKAAADKKAYDEALTKAQELLKKHDSADTPQDAKPTQKDINDALDALDKARTKLDAYKTDTTKLEEEANKSTPEHAAVTENDFENTPEFQNADAKKKDGADGNKVDNDDVKAYKDALAKARKLAQDNTSKTLSDHPTQKQIDDALEALKKAKQAITDGYKTDVDKLKQAKEYAEDVFKKTPEYKNAIAIKADVNNAKHDQAGNDLGDATKQTGFEGQIAKIAEKLNDTSKLTQREVDALVNQLKIAQNKIADEYKTNVTPLSNEVGDKDAQGNPVTPKFEESIPYKNALAKKGAESEDDAKKNDSATKKLEAYNEKLKAAQDLINQVNNPDPNAEADKQPTNADVKKALDELQKAKKDIDDAFATNAKALKDESAKSTADGGTVADADFEATTEYKNADYKKTEDGKDNADVTAYKDALKKARTLLEKFGDDGKPKPGAKDIPTQKEVDEALNNLKEIKEKIKKNYVTNPTKLNEEVKKSTADGATTPTAGSFEDTPAFKNVTNNSSDAAKKDLQDYNEKLKAAKDLLEAFDLVNGGVKKNLPAGMTQAPTQQQLDEALKALQDAKKKITDDYSTVKSDLRQEAGKDSDFTKSPEYQNAQAKGDDASKQALDEYKNALDEANSVLADPNATQAEVDAALKRLQDAKAKLKAGNSTDKSKLQDEADDDANFRKSPYFIIGNKADIEAYEDALAEAKSVLNDPNATQAQVDAALRKLQAAKAALLNSLSGASGHKIAKTGAATGLFAGFAAIFAGLGAAGVASRRRKHSKE